MNWQSGWQGLYLFSYAKLQHMSAFIPHCVIIQRWVFLGGGSPTNSSELVKFHGLLFVSKPIALILPNVGNTVYGHLVSNPGEDVG